MQLQQEQIQYVDNECCQVAVKSSTATAREERMNEAQMLDPQQPQQPQGRNSIANDFGVSLSLKSLEVLFEISISQ